MYLPNLRKVSFVILFSAFTDMVKLCGVSHFNVGGYRKLENLAESLLWFMVENHRGVGQMAERLVRAVHEA